jgi:small subunit ribosomal protein S9
MATSANIATGRRKSSSARVYLKPGKGTITVNGRPLDEFFGRKTGVMMVRQPLELVQMTDRVDINVLVGAAASPARPVPSATASRGR